jgi:hypothetical protein
MHENVAQPDVVDRVAGCGPGRVGHGHRTRRRDRPSPCPGAARHHRVRPAAVHARADPGAQPGADARAQPSADARGLAQPGAVPGTYARAIADRYAGTVTRHSADAGAHARPHPGPVTNRHAHTIALPLAQPGTLVAGKGASQAVEPRGVH